MEHAFTVAHFGNFLIRFYQQFLNALKTGIYRLLGNAEQRRFRLGNKLLRIGRRIVGKRRDLSRAHKEFTTNGVTAYNFSMMLPAGERKRVVSKLQQILLATNCFQLSRCLQVVGNGNNIDRDGTRVHFAHCLEDYLVSWSEEAFGLQFQGHFLKHARRQKACR